MFSSIHHCLLLADRSMLREMGSGLRERREHFGSSDLLMWALVIVVVSALLLIASRFIAGNDSQRLFNNAHGLFRALCHAHRLDRAEQRLLAQIARAEGIAPAMLFLSPAAFERSDVIAQLTRPEAVEGILAKLFAGGSASENAGSESEASPAAAEPSTATAETETASTSPAISPDAAPLDEMDPSNPAPADAEGERCEATRSAPSLFQPAPATVVPTLDSRGNDAIGPARRPGRGEECPATLTEQQAMRALEILMQQIKAERGAEPASSAQQGGSSFNHGYRADEVLWQPPQNPSAAELSQSRAAF